MEIEENKARKHRKKKIEKQRKKEAWEARFSTHHGHVWASKTKCDLSHVPQGMPSSQDQLGSHVRTKEHQGPNVTLTRRREAQPSSPTSKEGHVWLMLKHDSNVAHSQGKEAWPSLPPTTFGKGKTASRHGLSPLTTPRRGNQQGNKHHVWPTPRRGQDVMLSKLTSSKGKHLGSRLAHTQTWPRRDSPF
ncbi:hypothetical protein PIB30_050767 [Stylosanthes scabra]|uniref:Uncharacterized protein n=1 Tax=Stylosanthes scabra TaxID=79078 RepID=A0ABU6WL36_9FABA|nr:hypothetical protein [Stylosanthes scabra]